ncbi:MAG: YbaY family lipoprotein [Anaerolineae bacterium]|nr:YbaY family lipoprotein [Anaerolineae bacterium]
MSKRILLALIIILLLVPAAASAQQATGKVTGTVTYRERVTLPPTARVIVELQDVSRADAAATIVATQTLDPAGKAPPYPFELTYDPAKIDQRNTYAVRATIRDGDKLLFTSTQAHLVITRGNPTSGIEIVMQQVGGTPAPATPKTMPATGDAGVPLLLAVIAGIVLIVGGLLLRRRSSV